MNNVASFVASFVNWIGSTSRIGRDYVRDGAKRAAESQLLVPVDPVHTLGISAEVATCETVQPPSTS